MWNLSFCREMPSSLVNFLRLSDFPCRLHESRGLRGYPSFPPHPRKASSPQTPNASSPLKKPGARVGEGSGAERPASMETPRTRETALACRLSSSRPAGSALPGLAGEPQGWARLGVGGALKAQAKGCARRSPLPHSLCLPSPPALPQGELFL